MNVCLIGARSGSSMKNKNIRHLAGYPLIAYSIRAGLLAGLPVYVSTDSEEYAEISRKWGAQVIMRPAEMATATSTDYEYIRHALDFMGSTEYIVHLRPTTPLRDPHRVYMASCMMNHAMTSIRSVHEMSESAYKCVQINSEGIMFHRNGTDMDAINDPRQNFPKTYQPNGYVDVLNASMIRATGLLHGNMVMPFITEPVTEIDTEEDLDYAHYQTTKHPEWVKRLFK